MFLPLFGQANAEEAPCRMNNHSSIASAFKEFCLVAEDCARRADEILEIGIRRDHVHVWTDTRRQYPFSWQQRCHKGSHWGQTACCVFAIGPLSSQSRR